MYNLLWAPIAVTAGRELAMSGLPDAPVVADKRLRASRPVRRGSWRLPRSAHNGSAPTSQFKRLIGGLPVSPCPDRALDGGIGRRLVADTCWITAPAQHRRTPRQRAVR
jgi:hypothetical protein